MSSKHRLKRLREMLDQLERLPATAERDRMIREVRARAVDVDTGVATTALPPLFAEDSTPASDPPPKVRRAPKVVAPTPRATPIREPAKPVQASPRRATPGAGDRLTLAADDLLSLGDLPSLSPSEAPSASAPAWRRGLRG